jgi:malate/lactate dehydrogenase
MGYEEAWSLISAGKYRRKKMTREDFSHAAARIVREATEKD